MNLTLLRTRLTEKRDRLRHLLDEEKQALRDAPDQGVDDFSPASSDTETADAASGTYQQELDATFVQRSRDRLMQVEQAIWRIEHDLYGRCLRCGQTIPEGRLEALPETPFCVACAERVEARD